MSRYLRETPPGLVLIARVVAKPGMRDDLLGILEEAVRLTGEHEAEGPLMVSVNVSPADADLVVLVEHWPNRAALAEHQATGDRVPEYGQLRERRDALLACPIEVVEITRAFARFTRIATSTGRSP